MVPGEGAYRAHEAVLQQPDHLVAVARALVQQLEQVQPQPSVAEHGTHRGTPLEELPDPLGHPPPGFPRPLRPNPSGSQRSLGGAAQEGDVAGGAGGLEPAGAGAEPPPGRLPPGARSCSSSSKALATWPLVDSSLTSRSLAPGRRTVRSPETLDSRMSRSPDAFRSRVTTPETVPARTEPPPSATVRSPDTVYRQVPGDAGGLTAPETVAASAGRRGRPG